ncbi:hypothetical protein [Candidatus Amarolinea dominans]
MPADKQKLERIAVAHNLGPAYVIGRLPTPGFTDFLWGGHL